MLFVIEYYLYDIVIIGVTSENGILSTDLCSFYPNLIVGIERLQNQAAAIQKLKNKRKASTLKQVRIIEASGMSAESSVNAHAEALRLKSRHGIAVSKGIRTAFDAGQQEDLDYVEKPYLRDNWYPAGIPILIERLIQSELRPDPTPEYFVDLGNGKFGPRLWLDENPYVQARDWLIKHEKEFELAMGGKILNFRGTENALPTIHYIVNKLAKHPQVKPSRKFGIFFNCRTCCPFSKMYNNFSNALEKIESFENRLPVSFESNSILKNLFRSFFSRKTVS